MSEDKLKQSKFVNQYSCIHRPNFGTIFGQLHRCSFCALKVVSRQSRDLIFVLGLHNQARDIRIVLGAGKRL